MKKLTMFLLAALAAVTVAIGALAAAPSASARNDDDTPIQHQQCWLKTSYGIAFFPDGSVIRTVDANGKVTRYMCTNGQWLVIVAPVRPTATYTGSLATVLTRV